MEVEIISKECIKPSSPTPYHLKNHKLSFLDLYVPLVYIPAVLYYPLNQDANLSPKHVDHIVSVRLQLLKRSLSKTLSLFYPFAGKKKDLVSIDCNDEGVYFVRAQVKNILSEFLNHPDVVLTSKFLPDGGQWLITPNAIKYITGVQVTTFACGGIAIGACVSHMVADGTACSSFLKSWAATAHIAEEEATAILCPKFDGSSLFPHNDIAYPREACSSIVCTKHIKFDKYVTRRFVFDAWAIANLKAKITSYHGQNPTRVEAVTSLLTKCIIAALKVRYGSGKPLLLNQAVNLRRKATPPYSEYAMGNLVWMASALRKDNKEVELHSLASQLREAITEVNGDFLNKLVGDGGLVNFVEAVKYERETCTSVADNIVFSSWCNFGFYDVDFGWGKPAWVSMCGLAEVTYFYNLVVLMDTRVGKGIEAWVYLREEDMDILQLDEELLEFASMDPSIPF